MVNIQQVQALLDFLNCRPELALGHLGRTKEGRCLALKHWTECAAILNSVSADGPKKSASEWRSFYNEYKSKLIKKIKMQKCEQKGIDCGRAKASIPLTPLQKRLYDILGNSNVGDQHMFPPTTFLVSPNTSQYETEEISIEKESEHFNTETNFMNTSIPTMPSMSETPVETTIETPVGHSKGSTAESPRRRRPRPLRRQIGDRSSRFERIVSKKAEATLAHARATDRLAAALERIADRLSRPISIKIEDSVCILT